MHKQCKNIDIEYKSTLENGCIKSLKKVKINPPVNPPVNPLRWRYRSRSIFLQFERLLSSAQVNNAIKRSKEVKSKPILPGR
jgi:hypothetical protein